MYHGMPIWPLCSLARGRRLHDAALSNEIPIQKAASKRPTDLKDAKKDRNGSDRAKDKKDEQNKRKD